MPLYLYWDKKRPVNLLGTGRVAHRRRAPALQAGEDRFDPYPARYFINF